MSESFQNIFNNNDFLLKTFGTIHGQVSSQLTSSLPTLFQSISKIRARIQARLACVESLYGCLTSNADIFASEAMFRPIDKCEADPLSTLIPIDEDTASSILTVLSKSADEFHTFATNVADGSRRAITVVDGIGQGTSLIVDESVGKIQEVTFEDDVYEVYSQVTEVTVDMPLCCGFIMRRQSDGQWLINRSIPNDGVAYNLENPDVEEPLTEGTLDLYSVIANLGESRDEDSTWLQLSDSVRGGVSSVSDIVTDLEAKTDAAKYLMASVKSGFRTGGIIGACKALITFCQKQNTLDHDGAILTFVDPEFGATSSASVVLGSTIVSIVSGIASFIASIFNAAIGFAIQTIGSVVTQIFKGVESTVNDLSRCTVDELAELPVFPKPIAQFTSSLSEVNDAIKSVLDSGYCAYFELPGFYLVLGYSDETASSVSWQCFLSTELTYRTDGPSLELMTYFRKAPSGQPISDKMLVPADPTVVMRSWNYDKAQVGAPSIIDDMDYPSMHVANANTDFELQRAWVVSSAYFLLYCCSVWRKVGRPRWHDPDGGSVVTLGFSREGPQPDGMYDIWFDFRAGAQFGYKAWYIFEHLEAIKTGTSFNWSELTSSVSTDMLTQILNYMWIDVGYGQWDVFNYIAELSLDEKEYVFSHATVSDSIPYCLLRGISQQNLFVGEMVALLSGNFQIMTPKFDRRSLIGTIIASAAIIAVVSAVAIFASMKIKRARRKAAAKNAAAAEAAWSDMTENGFTSEKYDTYRKAVKKNNLTSALTGGDKVSYSGFWGDASGGAGLGIPGYSDPSDAPDDPSDAEKQISENASIEQRANSSVELETQLLIKNLISGEGSSS